MVKKQKLDVVIPVYNEEKELEDSVLTLRSYLDKHLEEYEWQITIADNASVDNTLTIAHKLAKKYRGISCVHIPQKGRGRAVKYVWSRSDADFLAYMDVDLSTDLKHLTSLVQSLARGYDIAIGTRNLSGSRVYGRSMLRTITSKGYIFLIKLFFWVHFSDAQCGFKAVTKKVVNNLLPNIDDNEWFFDTELLLVGEKSGYRIYEEPVTWIDNPGSAVRVLKTALGDLNGLKRLFFTRPWKRIGYAH